MESKTSRKKEHQNWFTPPKMVSTPHLCPLFSLSLYIHIHTHTHYTYAYTHIKSSLFHFTPLHVSGNLLFLSLKSWMFLEADELNTYFIQVAVSWFSEKKNVASWKEKTLIRNGDYGRSAFSALRCVLLKKQQVCVCLLTTPQVARNSSVFSVCVCMCVFLEFQGWWKFQDASDKSFC